MVFFTFQLLAILQGKVIRATRKTGIHSVHSGITSTSTLSARHSLKILAGCLKLMDGNLGTISKVYDLFSNLCFNDVYRSTLIYIQYTHTYKYGVHFLKYISLSSLRTSMYINNVPPRLHVM